MSLSLSARHAAQELIAFVDASPSPWHAVASAEARLQARGFVRLDEAERWRPEADGSYYVVRGGGSLIAFRVGRKPLVESGFHIVGAHTDSPGLRLKPRPVQVGDGLLRLAVEVYGGPILATFTDRDLTMAGRVMVRSAVGPQARLIRFDRPLLRLPNLAIHMNRDVNEQGLKLNKQTELPLILGPIDEAEDGDVRLRELLAEASGSVPGDVLSWDLAIHDVQKACFWGPGEEFIAGGRLDNLASCHAALAALMKAGATAATSVVALFDHEEVGSESAEGAAGNFISDVLTRLAALAGLDEEDRRRALARSFLVSADMAHAYQPNFPAAYEPGHKIRMNGGPVIKTNANQRYATNAETAARFTTLCEQAGVPCQQYAHRSDLGCGSTIGPLVAARLGIPSVDVGSPLWAMHSIRESAGALDQAHMIAALTSVFTD